MHNTNIPCGCLVEYEGDQTHQDYSINWCPLHQTASELLTAAIAAVLYMDEGDGHIRTDLNDAIEKITGSRVYNYGEGT